jgi:oligopeptide/dipeptide ABC transporter ATP-binding protein
VQAEILDLLRDLRSKLGLALLLITHDLGVVAEMADRVAVMYGGRIVEDGPVAEVFKTPAHPYTRGLLACLPGSGAGQRLTAIPGTVPSLGQFPRGCSFAPRCGDRMDVCDVTPPGVTPLPGARTVRCYLHGNATGEPT